LVCVLWLEAAPARELFMTKRLLLGSMIAAGVVILAAIADLAGVGPFGGTQHGLIMDIFFILSGGIVAYLAFESYRELN
jgi:peptidoglycan/LPS O-acetylase OafA/YrhL